VNSCVKAAQATPAAGRRWSSSTAWTHARRSSPVVGSAEAAMAAQRGPSGGATPVPTANRTALQRLCSRSSAGSSLRATSGRNGDDSCTPARSGCPRARGDYSVGPLRASLCAARQRGADRAMRCRRRPRSSSRPLTACGGNVRLYRAASMIHILPLGPCAASSPRVSIRARSPRQSRASRQWNGSPPFHCPEAPTWWGRHT
jgi:hypothetical protein